MDEVELRFEALQLHLRARQARSLVERASLQVEGELLSARADVAMLARVRAGQCNDDSSAQDVA